MTSVYLGVAYTSLFSSFIYRNIFEETWKLKLNLKDFQTKESPSLSSSLFLSLSLPLSLSLSLSLSFFLSVPLSHSPSLSPSLFFFFTLPLSTSLSLSLFSFTAIFFIIMLRLLYSILCYHLPAYPKYTYDFKITAYLYKIY